jgi:uncharacterized protein
MMRKFALLFTLFLPFSGNVSGQNTILWSVTDTASKNTSFLLGTYHQIGNSFVDSLPEIQEALFSTNVAIFESIDNGEKVRAYLNSRSDNSEYLTNLKKSDITFLQSLASDWAVPISKLKPLELLTKLQQVYFETQCGSVKPTDKWDHFDDYLIYLARSKNMTTVGLESDSLQTANITAFAPDVTWESVKKPIHTWVNNIKGSKHRTTYCQFAREYMSMSFNYQFDQTCNEDPMLKGRNDKWMKILPDYLRNDKCFIAVGLLHLYGDCGLIMQLRQQGFVVTEINLSESNVMNSK